MNVGGDGPDPAALEPAHERLSRLAREAEALPRQADHPCDVSSPPLIDEGGLDGSDGLAAAPLANDPVVPSTSTISSASLGASGARSRRGVVS